MDFYNFYFTETKLSVLRQFLNIFSTEKEINIDLEKDIKNKGYFKEVDKNTFERINRELSDSHKEYLNLKKRKKQTMSQKDDKILTRMLKRKQLELEVGKQIINVYKINIKGGMELISPYNTIVAAVAYETGRYLMYHGYIVGIITETDDSFKYFIGADKNGLKFFKNIFGTNMDVYIGIEADELKYKGRDLYRKMPVTKNKIGYINIEESDNIKKDIYNEIIKTWNSTKSNNFSYIRKDKIEINNIVLVGYSYILHQSDCKIGVYIGGKSSNVVIIFYGGYNCVEEIKELNLFDNMKTINNPEKYIFSNIKYVESINSILKKER